MPDTPKLEPLFLLHDEPIGSHADDAFTDDPFARTVAQAALGTTGPFTIGVYGGWGSGKTSILRAARTMINDDKTWNHVVTVEFNAWRYEREEHPIVPLVATIERAVTDKAAKLAKLTPKKKYAKQISWYEKASRHSRALLAGMQFKLKPELNIPLVGKIGAEATWTARDSLNRYKELQDELKKLDGEHWSALVDSSLSLSAFDALDRVSDAVGRAAGKDKANWPLVIVFVDDLDRCQADKAFELLENVRLVLCQPGFVFVLALNHTVVDAYITHLAETRYGKDRARLHKSYLEKIVQLRLTIPPRSERFNDFAKHVLDKRLSNAADPELRKGLEKLAKVFANSANLTPRTLVRRINSTITDIALRDPLLLPESLKNEDKPYLHFSGLCIVQRTLEAALGTEMTQTLAEDNGLCVVIAEKNIWGIRDALKARSGEMSGEGTVSDSPRGAGRRSDFDMAGWQEVFDAIWSDLANKFLWKEDEDPNGEYIAGSSVLTSDEGRRWLTKHEERRAVMRITVQRPDVEAKGKKGDDDTLPPPTPVSTAKPQPPSSGPSKSQRLSKQERAIIEDTIRQQLMLTADAPLSPAERARVTELRFFGSDITDAVAAWIANPATGLTGLTTLHLSDTQVTNEGVKALASETTGLKGLTALFLGGTKVTDEVVKALASETTGLKGLTTLYLFDTQVTDEGVKALASETTGIKRLTTLNLYCTQVTDEGIKALASQTTGLEALATLILVRTQVTDEGVKALASQTTGLKSLITLNLDGTQVTDEGVKALASQTTGLKALTTLYLSGRRVTDEGFKALASQTTGLEALTTLNLYGTQVTDEGVKAIKDRWPGITVEFD
jgi:hypothetical protein